MKMKSIVAVLLLASLLLAISCGTPKAAVEEKKPLPDTETVAPEKTPEETGGEIPPDLEPVPEPVPEVVPEYQEPEVQTSEPIARSYEYNGFVIRLDAVDGEGLMKFSGNTKEDSVEFLRFMADRHYDDFPGITILSVAGEDIVFSYPDNWTGNDFRPIETTFLNGLVEWVNYRAQKQASESPYAADGTYQDIPTEDVSPSPSYIDYTEHEAEEHVEPSADSIEEYIRAVRNGEIEVVDFGEDETVAKVKEPEWIELTPTKNTETTVASTTETYASAKEDAKDIPETVPVQPKTESAEKSGIPSIVFWAIIAVVAAGLLFVKIKGKKHRRH